MDRKGWVCETSSFSFYFIRENKYFFYEINTFYKEVFIMTYSKTNEMAELFELNSKLMYELGSIDYTKVSKDELLGLRGAINAAIRQIKYVKSTMEES